MRKLVLPLGLTAALLSPLASALDVTPPLAPKAAALPVPETASEPAGALTLETALALATTRNPTLSAARHELDAAEGGITQARVIPNPEVAVVMDDTRKSVRSTTAQVNLPVELGGKRSARIDAAQKARDLAQAQLGNTQTDLRAAVIGGFFGVLVAQERVRLAAGSAEIAARGAQVAARRVAAGKISPVEETKAGVELANAELELAEAKAALDIARQALASLWGNPSPRFAQASGDLDALPSRPQSEALRQAIDTAPALQASQRELERRQAVINVERSRQYPDVTLSLGAKRDNSAPERGTFPVLGITLPLPLFDRNQGNLYSAIRQADKAADEYQATRIRLDTELQQAASQLAVSRSSAQALRDTVLPVAQRA